MICTHVHIDHACTHTRTCFFLCCHLGIVQRYTHLQMHFQYMHVSHTCIHAYVTCMYVIPAYIENLCRFSIYACTTYIHGRIKRGSCVRAYFTCMHAHVYPSLFFHVGCGIEVSYTFTNDISADVYDTHSIVHIRHPQHTATHCNTLQHTAKH